MMIHTTHGAEDELSAGLRSYMFRHRSAKHHAEAWHNGTPGLRSKTSKPPKAMEAQSDSVRKSAPAPGMCAQFFPKKGRWCNFAAAAGHCKCRTHLDSSQDSSERVPCPLNPRHSVNKDQLERHLKVCSDLRDGTFTAHQPFYKKGVNLASGTNGAMVAERADREWNLVERITAAYPLAVFEAFGGILDPDSLLDASAVAETAGLGHAEKHGEQTAALSDLAVGQLMTQDTLVIEYGCGRGGLALSILTKQPEARCILVDRDTRRFKLEKRQANRDETVLRLRLDVADFDLASFLNSSLGTLPRAADFDLESLSNCTRTAERLEALWKTAAALQAPPWPPGKILACAKHFCGSATDLALFSLREASKLEAGSLQVAVCCATCCHHRCDAANYVNVPFLTKLGLCSNQQEFNDFVSTAGWAVGGLDESKRRVGLMTKRILDIGRVVWLKQALGLADARLVQYIDKHVTPENIAIVAGGSL